MTPVPCARATGTGVPLRIPIAPMRRARRIPARRMVRALRRSGRAVLMVFLPSGM
jgi:predicted lysophospholipase L1 biosynthesis ABC-type transport system permease subunit